MTDAELDEAVRKITQYNKNIGIRCVFLSKFGNEFTISMVKKYG